MSSLAINDKIYSKEQENQMTLLYIFFFTQSCYYVFNNIVQLLNLYFSQLTISR